MSGARLAWALACICTSVVAAAAAADDAASLELELARRPVLYLVVERDAPRLSIRVRGLELDAVPLQEVRTAWQGAAEPPELPLPRLWRVSEAPEAEWRRVVAPPELVPYEENLDEPHDAAPSPTPPPPRPDRYSVATDSGWRLAVAPSVAGAVPTGLWQRLLRGWRRLLGDPAPVMPPTLVLVVEDDQDARRIVHLFEPGMAVIVGGDAAVSSVRPAPETADVSGRP